MQLCGWVARASQGSVVGISLGSFDGIPVGS